MTTETFTLEPENYRPKYIVKYRHLSPSGNRALKEQSRKLFITNRFFMTKTEDFAFIVVLVFKLLSCKVIDYYCFNSPEDLVVNEFGKIFQIFYIRDKYRILLLSLLQIIGTWYEVSFSTCIRCCLLLEKYLTYRWSHSLMANYFGRRPIAFCIMASFFLNLH